MDLFNPADTRPIHFVGIGGAGMSALALIAVRRGVAVTGCDADPTGAADLSALGVTVHAGHDPSHLEGARAVVVTAAVPVEHPELRRARELDLPIVPRKVALAALVGGARSVGCLRHPRKDHHHGHDHRSLGRGRPASHRDWRAGGSRPGAETL